jgi:hypothetical protein
MGFAGGAFGAEAADDELDLVDDAFAERASGGFGNAVEVEVFDDATGVADEVMVLDALGVKAGGTAFDGDLADEAGLNEVAEIVVGGGAGGSGIETVDAFEDFGGGGVAVVLQ